MKYGEKKIRYNGGSVTYYDNEELRDLIFDRVMKYFTEYECFSGECIMQSDDPQIYASEVFADIADDIIKFKYSDE